MRVHQRSAIHLCPASPSPHHQALTPLLLAAGRYHLYISYACPWANRALATLYLKGLEDVIGLSVVHPTWGATRPGQDDHHGWQFADPDGPALTNSQGLAHLPAMGCIPDTVNGTKFVRDLYELDGNVPGAPAALLAAC